jgi:ADP-ribose pyrophosphatase YjhB (NUDIX family)
VEAEESAAAAARREVREECGIAVGDLTLLALMHHPQEGTDDHVAVFRAPWEGADEPRPDNVEVVQVAWVAPGSLPVEASPGTRRLLTAYWAGQDLGDRW